MKNIAIILFGVLLTFKLSAQNEEDALRYSRLFLTGTARSIGMGGAMGAIGGDFTSLSVNPAGLGVYRKSELTFSPGYSWNTVQSDFLGNKINQTRYGMSLGNIGYVISNNNGNESGWIGTNFGIGYNQLMNFKQHSFMSGINNSSSLLDNFTNFANDYPMSSWSDFYEGLAYDVDLVAYDSSATKYFNDFADANYGQLQERNITSSGNVGEFVFSAGANYNHKLYIGATVGLDRIRFTRNIEHHEEDQNDRAEYTEEFYFWEDLDTRGYGVNAKLGIIARPFDFLRLGAALHTPTVMFLNDYFTTDIEASYDPDRNLDVAQAHSPVLRYDYTLRTPWKFIGSAALTLGKVGLISVDYERIDYSKANLEGPDYSFDTENKAIEENFQIANNLKMGAELRFGNTYLRGGYGIYGSPLNISDPAGDQKYNVFSGGVGIRTSDFFMDFGYAKGVFKEKYDMYVPEMSNGSLNKNTLNNLIMTVGFRF